MLGRPIDEFGPGEPCRFGIADRPHRATFRFSNISRFRERGVITPQANEGPSQNVAHGCHPGCIPRALAINRQRSNRIGCP